MSIYQLNRTLTGLYLIRCRFRTQSCERIKTIRGERKTHRANTVSTSQFNARPILTGLYYYYTILYIGWLLGFYDSTRDKDDTTVGVGHSWRYCNAGYDQSQGRRPSTLKCIGSIFSKGDIEPQPTSQKLIRNRTASSSRSDGRSRWYVQYRADQSQTETIIAKRA